MRCKDKVALVTGGSRGIGRAICIALGREGAKVAVNYAGHREAAEEVVETIESTGGESIAVEADVSVKQEVDAMVDTVAQRFERLDVMVNNAGICPFAEVLDIDEETWDRTLAVNLKGTFLCSQAAAKNMVEKGVKGSIVSISSINNYGGGKLQAHYGATKAGQVNLMKSFAVGLAPHGIRCNSVLPGTVLTDVNREFLEDEETRELYASRILAGRIGDPEDIAGAVVFYASDESSYANGSELLVDGGALVNFA